MIYKQLTKIYRRTWLKPQASYKASKKNWYSSIEKPTNWQACLPAKKANGGNCKNCWVESRKIQKLCGDLKVSKWLRIMREGALPILQKIAEICKQSLCSLIKSLEMSTWRTSSSNSLPSNLLKNCSQKTREYYTI